MSAGELRYLVAFDSMVPQSADGGITSGDWSEQFKCRAALKYLRGSEPVMQNRLNGIQPVIIKVRSDSRTQRITPEWRARNARDGTEFNIRSVIPGERGFYIEILCEFGVPGNG